MTVMTNDTRGQLHPQIAACLNPDDRRLIRAGLVPQEIHILDLLEARTEALVPVEALPIKPADASRCFCRLQIGSRVWRLAINQWNKLQFVVEAKNSRSHDPDQWEHSGPYAPVISICRPSPPSAYLAVAKYSEALFSLRTLSDREVAEVAFQLGFLIGCDRGGAMAVNALRQAPAFALLTKTIAARSRKPVPHVEPDYWNWREAALLPSRGAALDGGTVVPTPPMQVAKRQTLIFCLLGSRVRA